MALGLQLVTERTDAGTPIVDTENDENIAHIQPDVGIVLGEGHVEGPGTLYVTTRLVVMHFVSVLLLLLQIFSLSWTFLRVWTNS